MALKIWFFHLASFPPLWLWTYLHQPPTRFQTCLLIFYCILEFDQLFSCHDANVGKYYQNHATSVYGKHESNLDWICLPACICYSTAALHVYVGSFRHLVKYSWHYNEVGSFHICLWVNLSEFQTFISIITKLVQTVQTMNSFRTVCIQPFIQYFYTALCQCAFFRLNSQIESSVLPLSPTCCFDNMHNLSQTCPCQAYRYHFLVFGWCYFNVYLVSGFF